MGRKRNWHDGCMVLRASAPLAALVEGSRARFPRPGLPMENAGYIALSRQTSLSREMDVIANNLANVTTPAFKGQTVRFQEYLNRTKDGTKLSYVEDAAM